MPISAKLLLITILAIVVSSCAKDSTDNSKASEADIIPPIITLVGDSSITLNQGEPYVELGATALDAVDGEIDVVISGSVDSNTLGTYTITYSAIDTSNNTSVTTRTIDVIDGTPPVIVLNGENPQTIPLGGAYTDPGATVTDNVDSTFQIASSDTVDTTTAGTYTLDYNAVDAAGNPALTITRTVYVIASDTTPPLITLNGENPITIVIGSVFTDPGATVTDNIDATFQISSSDNVDTATAGTYTLHYNASDTAGNPAVSVTRVVNVIASDTTPPLITLNGGNPVTVIIGGTFTDPGATVTDNVDATFQITSSDSVNTSTAGTYILNYNASDAAGNPAVTVTRTVYVSQTRPFITTWKTDISGFTAYNQLRIGTSGSGYNYTIDWGDGLTDSNVNGDSYHTYATPGTYTVLILGDFPRIVSGLKSDAKKLLSVEQWGDIQWQSMELAFDLCENLLINATDSPDLSQASSMRAMFAGASSFNQNISAWDVSAITDMSSMFAGATAFNQDLSAWDVSAVTNMWAMFYGATEFNQSLNNWDVSAVTNMGAMFQEAKNFDQAIGAWNVSSVANMSAMFQDAVSFNQDISAWNVSSVTDMNHMFARNRFISSDQSFFDQDLSSWNVSAVTDMSFMFAYANAFNHNLSTWDVSSVTNMTSMFRDASLFNQDLGTWDVSSVTDMNTMFAFAYAFNQDVRNWDVSSVTDMSSMFAHADAFNQDISAWDVSSVTNMSRMFEIHAYQVGIFNQDLSAWNVSAVTNMSYMFNGADSFNQDISGWDVSSVTTMSHMFYGASTFNQDISGWDVSAVTGMDYMFYGMSNFNQNIGNWDVSSVRIMKAMFASTKAFNQDIGAWNVSRVTNMSGMFSMAIAFDQDLGSWDVSAVTDMTFMFFGITLSTPNYDSILQGWSARTLQNDVTFDAGNSQYSSSAQAARDTLTNAFSWTVTDNGLAP